MNHTEQRQALASFYPLIDVFNRPKGNIVRWVLPLNDEEHTQLILERRRWTLADMEQVDIIIRWKSTHQRMAYGSIDKDGVLHPSSYLRQQDHAHKWEVWTLLTKLRDQPFETLAEVGKKTGICAICNTELTHEASIAMGIGPVCAARHGFNTEGWYKPKLELRIPPIKKEEG